VLRRRAAGEVVNDGRQCRLAGLSGDKRRPALVASHDTTGALIL
jgi:hypothetical protein